MIGLDTNVLVRYITQDDPIQAEQANRLLESLATGSEGYVTVIVQDTEIVWKALRNFKMGKADFPDCLIKETSMFAGCSAVVTFDAKAARDIGMSLIGSS